MVVLIALLSDFDSSAWRKGFDTVYAVTEYPSKSLEVMFDLIDAVSALGARPVKFELITLLAGEPASVGERGRSGEIAAWVLREGEDEPDTSVALGDEPSAGDAVAEPPKNEANGLIRPSLPAGAF